MKKRFPKRGSPKLKLFNLLKWIHEMVEWIFEMDTSAKIDFLIVDISFNI